MKINKHKQDAHQPADLQIALRAAKNENVTVIGQPRQKPKHFELLGRDAKGELVELHIELDGILRKHKSVKPNDEKWVKELTSA